jgi:N4-gp56 family major capsid protein
MNNQVQELGVMTTTDVTNITPKVIANVVEEIARETCIWSQFYKINTDLMSNGGTEVVFPVKNSGIVAGWGLTAGTGLTAGGMSFSAVTIAVKKGGVGIGIYGEAIRQSNRDVISDCIKEAGMVWAETLDIAAFEAMFPTATATACNKGTFVATTVPILGVKSVNPSTLTGFTIVNLGTSSSITYATDVVGTITYWYAPSNIGYANCGAGESSLTAKDILAAKSAIQNYKRKPSVLVVNSERLTDLLYDSNAKFLEGSAIRGNGEVYNGELGQLFGLRVIVNAHASTFAAVIIDPSSMGYQVVRKELDMKRDEYTGMSMDCLYFWGFAEKNFGVVNDRSYGAVVIKGTYAVDAGLGAGYP